MISSNFAISTLNPMSHRSSVSRLLCCSLVLLSIGVSSCGKKDDEPTEAAENKPLLKAEDQQDDRRDRRARLTRNRDVYRARLKSTAKTYSARKSAPMVKENKLVFKARFDGYVNEVYKPSLKTTGVRPNRAHKKIKAPSGGAKMLGVNFFRKNEYSIPGNRKAGVGELAQGNWNNITSEKKRAEHKKVLKDRIKGLRLSNGQFAQNLQLRWKANVFTDRDNRPNEKTPGSTVLMSSNLEGKDISLSLKGLNESGFKRYDLVLYVEYALDENQQDGAQQPISRVDIWETSRKKNLLASDIASGVKVSGGVFKGQARTYTRQDQRNRKFVQSNTGKSGHYIYFPNLKSSSFYVRFTKPVFGQVKQIRVAGFQVIGRR